MKKTLVALSVAAFAATSANAFTAYDADGTKVDVNGSLRLALDNNSSKTKGAERHKKHTNLHNDGSRFGFTVKHNIADDFYALGRLELRFDKATTSDQFGDLYAKRAYVGLGSKQYGELTFGRQLTIADDVGFASHDYVYGITNGLTTTSGNAVVRYDYKAIEGLQIGLNYNFADTRYTASDNAATVIAKEQADGTYVPAVSQGDYVVDDVKTGSAKSGYGAGFTYNFDVQPGQTATIEAAYTRDNFVTGTAKKHYKDAWEVALGYTIDQLTFGVDGSQSYEKKAGVKTRKSFIAVGGKYKITPVTSVYAGYGYNHVKVDNSTTKTRIHKYLLGADYKLHKNVVTFIEGGIAHTKPTKTTDTGVALGLRVHW